MKPFLSLFFLLLFSLSAHTQRIFMGEVVTLKSDTLRGEIWFGISGKLPAEAKKVYFSEDGEKVKRFKAAKLNSMVVKSDVTEEVYQYERKGESNYAVLVSRSRARDLSTVDGGAIILVSGDTIFGKYLKRGGLAPY